MTYCNESLLERTSPAVTLLKAMANERRLCILKNLQEGELSVGELNERLNLSQSALSQHLAWLRRDGLVRTRKEAQTVFYSLQSDEAERVIELLDRLFIQVSA
ncbi:metalloregulator ArsR/SmtB family transcription factor [Gallaecimonas kandeliae]|nr:metalloregulator ArsR/SmtB family transcription factor [Gallaecimonas kandeliae]WKE64967.1 metalloregulator ArsR/SmtB family transcription factor [Gallaecimonas kandeliae]